MITEAKSNAKIEFRRIRTEDRALYESYLGENHGRGCEYSFANLCLWGRQSMAEHGGNVLLFSQFNRKTVYPYPVGEGDKKEAIDAIIRDAHERGIPCRLTGLLPQDRQALETLYPGLFRFHCDEGDFDYVYDVNALADLPGKKYHGKRNHLARFCEHHPTYRAEPLSRDNVDAVHAMAEDWYKARMAEAPNEDYLMEQTAITHALCDFEALGMDGLVILDGDEVLAFTLGSFLTKDTFDIQFEKARSDVQGAYTVVNYEFARYLRQKYPSLAYLDREEDMGLEGLRRAKQSYRPHHMIEKYWAHLREEGYDY